MACIVGMGVFCVMTTCADGLVSESPTTAYDIPRVTSVDGPGSLNASTYGGEVVNIRGANFGPPSASEPYFEQVCVSP